MRTRTLRKTLVLGLALAALCPALYAQTGAASITGIVTDATGAAAPGVTVTAINQATNVEYSGTSNNTGSYTITSLPDAVLELFSQYHSKGSRNYGRFRNADADAIIDKAFLELDANRRTALLKEFQQKYFDEWMPIAQLVEQPERYFLQPRIRGFDKTTGPWGFTGYRVYSSAGSWWSKQ